jgi:hypothetical protein
MRRRLFAPLCVVILVAACAETRAVGARTPKLLLPDLKQEAPTELELTAAKGPHGDRRIRLGFRSATENIGLGPLEIAGHRPDRATPLMQATQLIRLSNGSTLEHAGAGSLRYIRLGDHQHWHLDDFMRYELRRASDNRSMRPSLKTGFCLGDRFNLDIFSRLPNEPPHAIFTSECGFHHPRQLNIREGISVGHADYYAATIEGQYMDFTTLPRGKYWLIHRADPENRLLESDESNNAASLLLGVQHIRTADGSRILRVTVLRTCPDSARC